MENQISWSYCLKQGAKKSRIWSWYIEKVIINFSLPWVLYQLSLGQLVKPRYDVVQSGTERIFVTVLDPFEGVFLRDYL